MTTRTIKGREAALMRLVDHWRERADRLEAMDQYIGAVQLRICANDVENLCAR